MPMTSREMINYLKKHGFIITNQSGSHIKLFHPVTNRTVTIPEWLNEEAISLNINFSQVLQDALIQKIGAKL